MERYILFSTIENSNWNRYKYDHFPSHGRNLSSSFRYFDLRGDVSSNRSCPQCRIYFALWQSVSFIFIRHFGVPSVGGSIIPSVIRMHGEGRTVFVRLSRPTKKVPR